MDITNTMNSPHRPHRPIFTSKPIEVPSFSSVCCCANPHSIDGQPESQSICSCPLDNNEHRRSRDNNIIFSKDGRLGSVPSAFKTYRRDVYSESFSFKDVQTKSNNEYRLERNQRYDSKLNGSLKSQEQLFEERLNPLNIERLRPIRQKTRNVVFTIAEDKSITLEFVQKRNGKEYVVEILRISSDGLKITLFYPNDDFGVLLQDTVMQIPFSAQTYDLDSLPKGLWHKYQIADNFVRLVKARTPKVRFVRLFQM